MYQLNTHKKDWHVVESNPTSIRRLAQMFIPPALIIAGILVGALAAFSATLNPS